jgi:hypothetical protein
MQAAATTLAQIYQGIGLFDGDRSTAKVLIGKLSREKVGNSDDIKDT